MPNSFGSNALGFLGGAAGGVADILKLLIALKEKDKGTTERREDFAYQNLLNKENVNIPFDAYKQGLQGPQQAPVEMPRTPAPPQVQAPMPQIPPMQGPGGVQMPAMAGQQPMDISARGMGAGPAPIVEGQGLMAAIQAAKLRQGQQVQAGGMPTAQSIMGGQGLVGAGDPVQLAAIRGQLDATKQARMAQDAWQRAMLGSTTSMRNTDVTQGGMNSRADAANQVKLKIADDRRREAEAFHRDMMMKWEQGDSKSNAQAEFAIQLDQAERELDGLEREHSSELQGALGLLNTDSARGAFKTPVELTKLVRAGVLTQAGMQYYMTANNYALMAARAGFGGSRPTQVIKEMIIAGSFPPPSSDIDPTLNETAHQGRRREITSIAAGGGPQFRRNFNADPNNLKSGGNNAGPPGSQQNPAGGVAGGADPMDAAAKAIADWIAKQKLGGVK